MTATIRIAAAKKPIHSRVSIWSVPGEWGAKARPFYSGEAAPGVPGRLRAPDLYSPTL
jgi:hypothetical protein